MAVNPNDPMFLNHFRHFRGFIGRMAGGDNYLLDFLQDKNPNTRANERMKKDTRRCEASQRLFIRLLFSSLQKHREDMKAQSDHADKIQPLSEPGHHVLPFRHHGLFLLVPFLLPPPLTASYHLIIR